MKFINFNEWKIQRDINESRKDKMKCPHPKNKEYCKEYKRFLDGEINIVPNIEDFQRKKPAFGHWDGKRAGHAPTRREVVRRKSKRGEGRYKGSWEKDQ